MIQKPQKVRCNQTRNEVCREEQKLVPKSPQPAMGKSYFVQLCRQNNKSEKCHVINAFKSPINIFDNIFGNTFSRINTVLLKVQNFAVCKMG